MWFYLHGYGEIGNDLEMVKQNGPPQLVAEGKQFPFVVVSPQCPSGFYWRGNVIMGLIDQIVENYSIDTIESLHDWQKYGWLWNMANIARVP